MQTFPRILMGALRISLVSLLICETALLSQTTPSTSATSAAPYEPPAASLHQLGSLGDIVRRSPAVEVGGFPDHPAKFITKLPGGQTYFEVEEMEIDDDGSSDGSPVGWTPRPVRTRDNGTMVIDHSHQSATSYGGRLPQRADKTDFISAFETPYIVLPTVWSTGHGFQVGDGAVVLRGDQSIYAVVADFGPNTKIGEMSVKAHELFGEEVVIDGNSAQMGANHHPLPGVKPGTFHLNPAKVTRNFGSKGPFLIIVFPSTTVRRQFKSVDESLKPILEPIWLNLTARPAK